MENFFRKYGWTVTLGLIALGALLLALMVNNILASQLAPLTVPELPEVADTKTNQPAAKPRPRGGNWDRTISQLCLFGCPEAAETDVCEGGCPEGQQCQEGECVPVEDQPAQVASDVPVPSELNLKMLGAMVADQPDYSMALIKNENTNETLVSSPGDYVTADAVVVEIKRDRVILKRNGRLEYIRMDKTISGDPSATTASTLTPTAGPRVAPRVQPGPQPRSNPRSGPDVKKLSKDRFEVSREAIQDKISDRKQLARQGRVVPNYSNGKRDGLKLVGISPKSVYSELGIQSGDVIHQVNGKEIKSSHQAMELFEQMKNSGSVTVEIERRGQRQKLQYKIK